MGSRTAGRRWLTGAGLGVALIAGAGAPSAHEPVLLDPHRATPGLRLALEAVAPPAADTAVPGYRLVASGLPAGVEFNVWTKHFGHGFHEVASGFRADESGRLVGEMTFQPEADAYPRGAIWEVALASADLAITTFAKVIPRPMVARNGPCTVSLELISYRGERFLVSGSGFPPGADVTVESRYSGRVSQRQRRVSASGVLPAEVISHTAPGPDRSARYSVKARSCEVALDYEWGEPALRGR